MSEYDLRSAFPLSGKDFVAHGMTWKCQLAEVSDMRPEADRLSWYLVFQSEDQASHKPAELRKLEIVTTATNLLEAGFPDDLADRLVEWLLTDEQDGRREWLDY
jgi:hypothetical protein